MIMVIVRIRQEELHMTIADRQGDVILVHTDIDPEAYLNKWHGQYNFAAVAVKPIKGRVVLAEGEVTGHAHVMEPKGVAFLKPPNMPQGHSVLVVAETTVQRGDFIEGEVLGTMPGGTVRFRQTDGTVIRFNPADIEIMKAGVKVKIAYSPLKHDEHDAIPVGRGVYTVIQHQTAESRGRTLVND
jgi:hypothetical protein